VIDVAIEEGSIDGNHLIMICTLSLNTKEIPSHTLIDCGATGYIYIDHDFTDHHELHLCHLKTPCSLDVIDGYNISSGNIMNIVEVYLSIHEHGERLPIFVTNVGHYQIVLDILGLKQHDVAICFTSNVIMFSYLYFLAHYIYLFIYYFIYFLILMCNRKVMVEATLNTNLSSRLLPRLPTGWRPRAVFGLRVVVALVS
jgi:hypothetical protein